jgi:tellurite methyltransferase
VEPETPDGGHGRVSIPLLLHQARLTRGRALDVAGGPGENDAMQALAGWGVTTLDLSDRAVRRAEARARELRGDVSVVQAGALRLSIRGPFETIVFIRFLERSMAPELAGLLAPGGTLICEQPRRGLPPEYGARPGEFPGLFAGLATVLDTMEGDRAVDLGRRA